jgi:predicted CXXCH cytochrome family protein
MALFSLAPNESTHDLNIMPPVNTMGQANITSCYICHSCVAPPASGNPSLWDPHAGTAVEACATGRRGGNVSLMCLSCHDGAIAPIPPTSEDWFAGQRTLGVIESERSSKLKIGHHPIWVSYPLSGNAAYAAPGETPGCSLPLFSSPGQGRPQNRVECPTCHAVHFQPGESYLRAPKERFELCLCCHRELPPLSSEVFLPMQKERDVIEKGECRSCHNM